MQISIHDNLAEVDAAQWNVLVPGDAPFLRHEFLAGLEITGCVEPQTGWTPQHIVLRDSDTADRIIGAVPLYLKTHSYGEYVFDWAWADAYRRSGLEYYPKLVAAVPFTPVTGPRILCARGEGTEVLQICIDAVQRHAQDLGVSSLHWLFTELPETERLLQCGLLRRVGTQFHWHNRGYRQFDDYLGALSAGKRKKIRRERRRVAEQDIQLEVLCGAALEPEHMDIFYRFYRSTIEQHGAIPYLQRAWFQHIRQTMADHIVLILAVKDGRSVAGALNFRGSTTLYGRYWGATEWYADLHFETCYYRAIQYCIDQGLTRFEAGAQGEHKLNRGLLPVTTYSAHWLRHPQFAAAISDYLHRETAGVAQYNEILQAHSPYRREV